MKISDRCGHMCFWEQVVFSSDTLKTGIIASLTWPLLSVFIFSLFTYCLFFFFFNQTKYPGTHRDGISSLLRTLHSIWKRPGRQHHYKLQESFKQSIMIRTTCLWLRIPCGSISFYKEMPFVLSWKTELEFNRWRSGGEFQRQRNRMLKI